MINVEKNKMTSLISKYALNEEENEKKVSFFNLLKDKINKNITLEKLFFFDLIFSYTLKDDIDFSYKTKITFLGNFLFEMNSNGGYIKKVYAYVSPIDMSLYCPEFYETINETFEGENISLPTELIEKENFYNEKEKEDMKYFFDFLTEFENKIKNSINVSIPTLLLIKWLKSANYAVDDIGWFYSSFRKLDVLANDEVSLHFVSKKKNINSKINTCKDMLVWKLLNGRPYPMIKKTDHEIMVEPDFFKELDLFFENKKQ